MLHALAAPRDDGLAAALGPARAAEVRDALALLARRWAARVAPGRAYEATTLGAAAVALHEHEGPVLLVAPDVPGLDTALAHAALADLADGALVVVAPSTDGSPFLVGVPDTDIEDEGLLASPFERVAEDHRIARDGVGLLRSERRLVGAADAAALVADPLVPVELRALLTTA